MSDDGKLRFTARAIRRELPSDHHELSPVTDPAIVSYGDADRTAAELSLALSELAVESRPQTVARHLLPDGVRLEDVEVQVGRPELPGRLGRRFSITLTVAVVPEVRPDAGPAGHWVFIPALDHACYVDRGEAIAERVAAELAVLPSALALDADGWRRLLGYAPARLEELTVELSTTPLAQAAGRKALAEAERRRLAAATLDRAGRRLDPAGPPPPLVGRDLLLAELGRILDAPARRSVLLVGEEAAGKSALVAAWAAGRGRRPVWATSAAELVAGASGLGEWQERVAAVLAAAEALDAILYFDDFGAVFADRPAEGGVDLGAALRRHVVDGRARVIGELTPVALDRAERRDVSLVGAMLRVTVPPTDPQTTTAACSAWAEHWARTQPHRPQIAPAAVPAAVELARRYLPYRAFPGKAVRLLEELRVAHDAGRDARGKGPVLGAAELYAAFSWATGVPIALLADDRPLPPDDVVAALRRRVVGQDAAVRRVAEAIAVAKARLAPADKPLASLLFVGPSGVGKTELARSVAAYLFGAPERMVRLDMSEYTDPWAAERLFGGGGAGAAENAAAADDDGRLTAAVRSQPFGVVLLDEIEKAHPAVFDLLLQVLGEARLTDGRGRTTFFHNAIIVLTSNLGTRGARGRLGLGPGGDDDPAERQERRFRDAVLGAFRPELVNRLDQIVVFHPLDPAEIARVAELAVARLAERRGLTQGGVTLDVSPGALERIAEGGFAADLGARALRRHLEAAVLAPAARLLARAGAEGQGGTLTVRAPDEAVARAAGSKLGEEVSAGLAVALWRRSAATGRRLVRSALAVSGLRRETERELALPPAAAVRERLGELEATLATATLKQHGKQALPGPEIARLYGEHARLLGRWQACAAAQQELRTAEELCLEALARDVDAIDLIDGALQQRDRFRRDLLWLLTAMAPVRPGATLLVHSPDARAAVTAWVRIALAAAGHHGFGAHVHLWGDAPPGWARPWGPPRDLPWAEEHLAAWRAAAALVRITGPGADLLFGLEEGLHRFHGLAGEAAHAWVDLVEPLADFDEPQWARLPGPPTPRAARGAPMREVTVDGDRTLVGGDPVDVPWAELPARLAEAAVVRLLEAHRADRVEALWRWARPVSARPPDGAPEGGDAAAPTGGGGGGAGGRP